MACRQSVRAGLLLRSIGFQRTVLKSQNGLLQAASRVSQFRRSPFLINNNAALASAAFHTSSLQQNQHIISIQDEDDFDTRVKTNPKPVIVDFFATWCGPCKLLIPRLESLSAVKDGKAILAKVDIDELPDLAGKYGVEAVPTVLAVKNGKVIDKFVGLKDDAALQSFVDKLTG